VAYGSLIESESIRDLTIRPVDLPLEHPVETASGVLRTAALVLPRRRRRSGSSTSTRRADPARAAGRDGGRGGGAGPAGAGVEWDGRRYGE
jgi:hypothetical protein